MSGIVIGQNVFLTEIFSARVQVIRATSGSRGDALRSCVPLYIRVRGFWAAQVSSLVKENILNDNVLVNMSTTTLYTRCVKKRCSNQRCHCCKPIRWTGIAQTVCAITDKNGSSNSEFWNRIEYELNSDDTESNTITNRILFEFFRIIKKTIFKAALDAR